MVDGVLHYALVLSLASVGLNGLFCLCDFLRNQQPKTAVYNLFVSLFVVVGFLFATWIRGR